VILDSEPYGLLAELHHPDWKASHIVVEHVVRRLADGAVVIDEPRRPSQYVSKSGLSIRLLPGEDALRNYAN
jgi:hypothetical protein